MAITIAMEINPRAPGWNILEWFQNNIRNVEMVCYIIFIKQTFYGTFLEHFLMLLKLLEQTIRILPLEQFWNCSETILKCSGIIQGHL